MLNTTYPAQNASGLAGRGTKETTVVFVSDGDARLVVRRETYQDLLITDVG